MVKFSRSLKGENWGSIQIRFLADYQDKTRYFTLLASLHMVIFLSSFLCPGGRQGDDLPYAMGEAGLPPTLPTSTIIPIMIKNLRYYLHERNHPPLILSCHQFLNQSGLFLQGPSFWYDGLTGRHAGQQAVEKLPILSDCHSERSEESSYMNKFQILSLVQDDKQPFFQQPVRQTSGK
jgi:hypothetical protein